MSDSNWAPAGFSGKAVRGFTSLADACRTLTPKARQAFYAAAKRGPIAQRTWDGCAFNAGGTEINANVNSFESAGLAFDMSADDVARWIRYWDAYGSTNPTHDLIDALDEVGLFSGPADTKFVGKTFVKVVHESEKTKFEKMVANLDLNEAISEEDAEFKNGVSKAADLIFA